MSSGMGQHQRSRLAKWLLSFDSEVKVQRKMSKNLGESFASDVVLCTQVNVDA